MKNIRVQDIPVPRSLEGVEAAIDLCNLKLDPMREGLQAKTERGDDCEGVNRAIKVWEDQRAVYEKMRLIYESPGSKEAFDTIERYKQSLKGAERSVAKIRKFTTEVLCEIRETMTACPSELFPPQLEPIWERVKYLTRDTYPEWEKSRVDPMSENLSDLVPEIETKP